MLAEEKSTPNVTFRDLLERCIANFPPDSYSKDWNQILILQRIIGDIGKLLCSMTQGAQMDIMFDSEMLNMRTRSLRIRVEICESWKQESRILPLYDA